MVSCKSSVRAASRRAFTLIELLVVVAIIALLISLLLPSLSRAQAQSRSLVCLTNLRAIGEAANFYAADNRDFIPRGNLGLHGGGDEYAVFSSAIVKYLGHFDGDPFDLWSASDQTKRRNLNDAARATPQYHCPDYPQDYEPNPVTQSGTSPFDYGVNAFPIPYTDKNLSADSTGDLEWKPDAAYQGEATSIDYIESTKIEQLPAVVNAARIIYVTEKHTSLPWTARPYGMRFNTFFLTSQLPFGGRPRIANDQRHPNGINALFFAGNAETLDLHQIDAAWPNPISMRLRYFTFVPEELEP